MKQFLLFLVAYILTAILTPFVVIGKSLYYLITDKNKLDEYFFTAAIGFDQAGGSVLYNQENYTISSYSYFLCRFIGGHYCYIEKAIDKIFGENHCKNSFMWEIEKDREDNNSVYTETSLQ